VVLSFCSVSNGHQRRDHHAQADGTPLPHDGGDGPSGTRGGGGAAPKAATRVAASTPPPKHLDIFKAPLVPVPCACVLVSTLYYRPSVNMSRA